MLHVTRHNHSRPGNRTPSEKRKHTVVLCNSKTMSISFSGLHVTPLTMSGNTAQTKE